MPTIATRGLHKLYGPHPDQAVRELREGAPVARLRERGVVPAVVDVDLAVEPGEVFVVMGLSGSGKSTLLRMLNGLVAPTAGMVHVDGVDLATLDPAGLRALRQERISMVFQHFALLPHRTVLQNTAYPLEVRGVDRSTRLRRAADALARVGLADRADAAPAELSGGMQQRVGLARALAADTDVLLMDEAFSALDPLIRRGMQDQLLDLQRELGKTIVFITHDLDEAMRLGDRVAIMRDGRVVQCGTPEQILAAPADDQVARFLADVDRARVVTAGSLAEPTAVLPASAGTAEAVAELTATGAAHLVLADAGRPVGGVVGAVELLGTASRHAGTPVDLARPPAACVLPGTPLVDLLAPAAGSGRPVVVVDEAGRPLGVVPLTALLGALAPGDGPAPPGAGPDPAAPGADREVAGV